MISLYRRPAAAILPGMRSAPSFDVEFLAETLDVPRDWKLVGYLCIGHPETDERVPALQHGRREHRRPSGEFVTER